MNTQIKNIIGAVCIICGLSSCNDFLDILPMNEVVLENYWTEKGDVTSSMNGCYEAMCNGDVVTRMNIWGELRSDNITSGASMTADLNEMLKENLQPANSMCDWSKFYQAINRCNILIHYAPEVQAIDPNYTEDEMKANIAEATTLRALCYFYLIRAFRDVPYITEPSIDDNQNYVVAAMPFNQVLDSLINDLERVKDDAVRRYSVERVVGKSIYVPSDNTSRITRWAVYTLLADLYLWKSDWKNVIKYCDLVIDYKKSIYEELLLSDQINNVEMFNGVPLILEKKKGDTECGNAYNEIFGEGNSFESIFELYFTGNSGSENSWVSTYYGNTKNRGRLRIADFIMEDMSAGGGKNNVFWEKDCRFYEANEKGSTDIAKYRRYSVTFDTKSLATMKIDDTWRGSSDANWIIYRLSDVVLMKAEALIQDSTVADKAAAYQEAFLLINAINKRALNVTEENQSADTLKMSDYVATKNQIEGLLFDERQREFLFEGKRWFDLVRLSRYHNNTEQLTAYTLRKFNKENTNVIKIKLTDPNYIYFPYSKKELKVNTLLVQNPAYSKAEAYEH